MSWTALAAGVNVLGSIAGGMAAGDAAKKAASAQTLATKVSQDIFSHQATKADKIYDQGRRDSGA